MFITILCFLSVAMTIAVIHLHTNSVVAHPSTVPLLVSSQFLPRDAMIARYMLGPVSARLSICQSLRLSVTSRSSTKTAKRIGSHKQGHTIAQDSSFVTLKILVKFNRGHP